MSNTSKLTEEEIGMAPYLLHWFLASLALMITAYLVPGFKIDGFMAALIASVVIGIVNVFVWPLIAILTLPLTVFTFGLFLLVVNGIALKIAAALTPGFLINGFMPAVVGSIVLTIVGWLIRFVVYGGHVTP
jgi:putative membrane protein